MNRRLLCCVTTCSGRKYFYRFRLWYYHGKCCILYSAFFSQHQLSFPYAVPFFSPSYSLEENSCICFGFPRVRHKKRRKREGLEGSLKYRTDIGKQLCYDRWWRGFQTSKLGQGVLRWQHLDELVGNPILYGLGEPCFQNATEGNERWQRKRWSFRQE